MTLFVFENYDYEEVAVIIAKSEEDARIYLSLMPRSLPHEDWTLETSLPCEAQEGIVYGRQYGET